jgi:oleandomycin transport system ATP-binding protein
VRILATLLRPDGGAARVCGLDVVREAAEVRRLIGLTGQYASVDEDLTGVENLVMIARLLDLRRAAALESATGLLEAFGLSEAAEQRVSAYSGGMRRRLDLAASLVGDPAVVFLDEPTTGLDPAGRERVWEMIRSMSRRGVTVLLTTQYLEEAEVLADDVAVVDHGRMVAQGPPGELKRRIGGQTVEVRPQDLGRAGEAAALLEAVAGRRAETAADGVLSVRVDDDRAFTEAVRVLDRAGIGVTEMALRLPSLDEVFLALTGHRADTADQMEGVA